MPWLRRINTYSVCSTAVFWSLVEFSRSPAFSFHFHVYFGLHRTCTPVLASSEKCRHMAVLRRDACRHMSVAFLAIHASSCYIISITVCSSFHLSFSLFHSSSSSAFCSDTFSSSSLLWSIISDMVITTCVCMNNYTCTHTGTLHVFLCPTNWALLYPFNSHLHAHTKHNYVLQSACMYTIT